MDCTISLRRPPRKKQTAAVNMRPEWRQNQMRLAFLEGDKTKRGGRGMECLLLYIEYEIEYAGSETKAGKVENLLIQWQ